MLIHKCIDVLYIMLWFDRGVSNILSGYCSLNTGFPLLSFGGFFVVPSIKCYTLDFLRSITIHFVFNKVTFQDGRSRQLLFAHNCCRWKEGFSDKQIALFAPPAAGRKHWAIRAGNWRSAPGCTLQLQTSFIRSPLITIITHNTVISAEA